MMANEKKCMNKRHIVYKMINYSYNYTCMECPVGFRGNLNVSLKDGSLSWRQTLVFFLMILFWVATFTTYSLTYRSDDRHIE